MLLECPASHPVFLPHSILVSFGDTLNSCPAPHTILSHSCLPSNSVRPRWVSDYGRKLCDPYMLQPSPGVVHIQSLLPEHLGCDRTVDLRLSMWTCESLRCPRTCPFFIVNRTEPVSHDCIHRALTCATAFALSAEQVVGPSA